MFFVQLTTMAIERFVRGSFNKFATDFTGPGLWRLLQAWVYDLRKADPQLGYNNGEGLVSDVVPDRPGMFYYHTGCNADHEYTLKLTYGDQEAYWRAMMHKMAEVLEGKKERKVYITARANADDCNVTMFFSWNGSGPRRTVSESGSRRPTLNEMFFSRTRLAVDPPVTRHRPACVYQFQD